MDQAFVSVDQSKANTVQIFNTKDVSGVKTVKEKRMADADKPDEGELILYRSPEGAIRIEVL